MTINVLINGAFGRMGQMTTDAISKHPGLTLVGQTGRDFDLHQAIKDAKADVVIDFTEASVIYKNAQIIIDAGARPVIGTSGLKSDEVKKLQARCAELKRGGIIAPNFSLGAVLMMKYAKAIANYFPHVEIIEMHHDGKQDSPSGTALRTAELLAESDPNLNHPEKPNLETIKGARGANHRNVPIHAIRLPGLLAHQTVIFGGTGESISIRHDSLDRQCFMPGVCLATEKVMHLDKLVYGLEEIL